MWWPWSAAPRPHPRRDHQSASGKEMLTPWHFVPNPRPRATRALLWIGVLAQGLGRCSSNCGVNGTGFALPPAPNTCLCPGTSVCRSGATGGCTTTAVPGGMLPLAPSVLAGFSVATCPDCHCEPAPIVYTVSRPTSWTIWHRGAAGAVRWDAASTAGSVSVVLIETLPNNSVVTIATISSGVPASAGGLDWPVPLSLVTQGQPQVVVVAGGGSNVVASAVFNITAGFDPAPIPANVMSGCTTGPPTTTPDPNGTCSIEELQCMLTPPLLWPPDSNCSACARGEYQVAPWSSSSGCSPCCASCPTGLVTAFNGSVGASSCAIREGSVLAGFERTDGFALRLPVWYIRTVDVPVTAASCAQTCVLDHRCKSFDFEPCASSLDGNGRCRLAREVYSAALSHTLVRSAGTSHYHMLNTTSATATFVRYPGSFPLNGSVITTTVDTSIEGCASLCSTESGCQSFVSGTGPRLGHCVLYQDANGTRQVVSGAAGAIESFDYYVLPSSAPCPPGSTSSTGSSPNCTLCPVGSYAPGGTSQCTACPVSQTTRQPGSVNSSACAAASCPVGSTGPDPNNDCRCEVGASCTGSALCSSNATTGRHFFNIFCEACSCSVTIDPPTINSVDAPLTDSTLLIGQNTTIEFRTSNSVQYVYIRLFRMHDTLANTVTYVSFIGVFAAAGGSVDWIVPDVPERDDYVIVVNHYPYPSGAPVAPTHRNTGAFSIRRGNYSCDPGTINNATGVAPCTECPIGTYWFNSTVCAQCPNGTTTADTTALSIGDCSVNADHPLFTFTVFPHHYLRGSSIPSGFYLEEIDHKTLSECAQLCLDDGGCKSFMAGVPDQHQAGDCFLSYDDRGTIWPGGFVEISQLSYYERQDTGVDVSVQLFERDAGCFLVEHDDGGLHESAFTPEACAQLCLNDVCCESFDAGEVTSANAGHCFLSYTTKTQTPNAYVCDSARQLHYYDLLPYLEVTFGDDVTTVVMSSRTLFESTIASTAQNSAPQPPNVSVHLGSDNRIIATIRPASRAELATLTDLVNAGMLSFTFPRFVGRHYVATFSPTEGPCDIGTVSQTGQKPCMTCRSDTYANKARTQCQACPEGTQSPSGSHLVEQCTVPTLSTALLLNLHDEFVGRFFEPTIGGGSLTLRVSNITGNAIEIIATVEHGGHCNTTLDCRTEGKSEYYLQGTVLNDTLLDLDVVSGYYGWVGITDRGFARAPLFGRIEIGPELTLYHGSWGQSGSFNTSRRCTVSAENVTSIQVGDAFSGYFECDTPANSQNPREVVSAELTIESIGLDGHVSAVVRIVTENGTYAYGVGGAHDPDARCSGLQLTAQGADDTASPAWRTTHPDGLIARQWSGHISENGEHYIGTVNSNPHCACIDSSPYPSTVSTTIDQFCGRLSERECWVASSCPEAVESTQYPGWYFASIGPHQSCSTFKLARVCNIPPQLCAIGWTQFSQRCYKVFSTPQTLEDAVDTCSLQQASLVSIHSAAESYFTANLVSQNSEIANVDLGDFNGSTWIGLSLDPITGTYQWSDNSLFVFTDWASDYPHVDAPDVSAVVINENGTGWTQLSPNESLPFVCKKGLLAVNTGCSCSGISDGDGLGAMCMYWGDAPNAWCYTSQHCRNAAFNTSSNLWRKPCTSQEVLATCRLTDTVSSPFTTPNGFCCPPGHFHNSSSLECGRCLSQADCTPGSILTGTCTQSGSFPTCEVSVTSVPTTTPTARPTFSPTSRPTATPTNQPTHLPSSNPTTLVPTAPTAIPTSVPTFSPCTTGTHGCDLATTYCGQVQGSLIVCVCLPGHIRLTNLSCVATLSPSATPSASPTARPSTLPSAFPSVSPSQSPSPAPTTLPTGRPTLIPTVAPTQNPIAVPTLSPTNSPTNSPTSIPTASPTTPPTTASSILLAGSGSSESSNTHSRHIANIYIILLVILVAIAILIGLVVKLYKQKNNVIHVMNVVRPDEIELEGAGAATGSERPIITETAFGSDGDYAELPAREPEYAVVPPSCLVGAPNGSPVYFDPAPDPFDIPTQDSSTANATAALYATVRPRRRTVVIDSDDEGDSALSSHPVLGGAGLLPSKARASRVEPSPNDVSLEAEVYETEQRLERMRAQLFERTMVPPGYDESMTGGAAAASGGEAAATSLVYRSPFQRQLDKQRQAIDQAGGRKLVDPFDVDEVDVRENRRASGSQSPPEPLLPGMVDDDDVAAAAAAPSPTQDAAFASQLTKEAIALEAYRRHAPGRQRLETPQDRGRDDGTSPPEYPRGEDESSA